MKLPANQAKPVAVMSAPLLLLGLARPRDEAAADQRPAGHEVGQPVPGISEAVCSALRGEPDEQAERPQDEYRPTHQSPPTSAETAWTREISFGDEPEHGRSRDACRIRAGISARNQHDGGAVGHRRKLLGHDEAVAPRQLHVEENDLRSQARRRDQRG